MFYMIYEHFRETGAHEAVQGLSDLFNIRLQNDNVRDFDVRWDQALLLASETPIEMVLEGLYKLTLQDSVQLQNVSALDDQETNRNSGQPSYQKLKTSVRLHIDQTIRTRNFRAGMKLWIEEGVSKSREEESKPTLREQRENAFNGSQRDNVPKETCAVSTMTLYLETDTRFKEEKDDRLLLHPTQRQRLTGKNLSTYFAAEGKAHGKEGRDSIAETKVANTRRVITGILPHVRITSQKQDAFIARSVVFDMLRQKRSPSKSQRRVVRKDQLRF